MLPFIEFLLHFVLETSCHELNKKTHTLRLPPGLHNCHPPPVFIHRLDIIPTPHPKTDHAQHPEDKTQGFRNAEFQGGRAGFEMEADHDRDGYDCHVDAEAEVGEKGALVRAVIACVAVGVVK